MTVELKKQISDLLKEWGEDFKKSVVQPTQQNLNLASVPEVNSKIAALEVAVQSIQKSVESLVSSSNLTPHAAEPEKPAVDNSVNEKIDAIVKSMADLTNKVVDMSKAIEVILSDDVVDIAQTATPAPSNNLDEVMKQLSTLNDRISKMSSLPNGNQPGAAQQPANKQPDVVSFSNIFGLN